MKCDECLNLLAEYIDAEASEHEAASVSAHLTACANCANEFEVLTAEKEMFARYDRELNVSPAMWQAIAARTAAESRAVDSGSPTSLREWFAGLFAAPRWGYGFSGALAVSIFAVVFGLMYLRMPPQPSQQEQQVGKTVAVVTPVNGAGATNALIEAAAPSSPGNLEGVTAQKPGKRSEIGNRHGSTDDPGVLFADVAYSELAERDTAEHIQQAENLLRSIRSLQASDEDTEIDVSYEKAMSRRLLDENEVLRRDAEAAGKFPTKELLKDLEPLLIDIASLPDKTTPDKLRVIKDRVKKTEMVAALVSY